MFAATKPSEEIQKKTEYFFDYEKLTGFSFESKEPPSKFIKEKVLHILKVLEQNNLQNDMNIRAVLFRNRGCRLLLNPTEDIAVYQILKKANLEKNPYVMREVFYRYTGSKDAAITFVEAFGYLREVNLDQDKQIIEFIFRQEGWGTTNAKYYAKQILELCKPLIKAGLLKAEPNCPENFEILSILIAESFLFAEHVQNIINAFELLKAAKLDKELAVRSVVLAYCSSWRVEKAEHIITGIDILRKAKLDHDPELRRQTIYAPCYYADVVAEAFANGQRPLKPHPAKLFTTKTNFSLEKKDDIRKMVFAWKDDIEFKERFTLIRGGPKNIGEIKEDGYYYSGRSNEYDDDVRLKKNLMMTADMLSVHLYNKDEEQLAKYFSNLVVVSGASRMDIDEVTFNALVVYANPGSEISMTF